MNYPRDISIRQTTHVAKPLLIKSPMRSLTNHIIIFRINFIFVLRIFALEFPYGLYCCAYIASFEVSKLMFRTQLRVLQTNLVHILLIYCSRYNKQLRFSQFRHMSLIYRFWSKEELILISPTNSHKQRPPYGTFN